MDVILVGFIAGFIFGGWRTGFLRRFIGILFMVVSFVVSAYIRYPVGALASTFFKNIPADYANLVGYAIAVPIVLAGLHIAGHFVLGRVQVRGVAREVDRGLGAILGGIEAVLIVSAAVVILDAYFGTSSSLAKTVPPGYLKELAQSLNGSETVRLLHGSTVPVVLAVLGPLLPKDVGALLPGGLPGRLPFPAP